MKAKESQVLPEVEKIAKIPTFAVPLLCSPTCSSIFLGERRKPPHPERDASSSGHSPIRSVLYMAARNRPTPEWGILDPQEPTSSSLPNPTLCFNATGTARRIGQRDERGGDGGGSGSQPPSVVVLRTTPPSEGGPADNAARWAGVHAHDPHARSFYLSGKGVKGGILRWGYHL